MYSVYDINDESTTKLEVKPELRSNNSLPAVKHHWLFINGFYYTWGLEHRNFTFMQRYFIETEVSYQNISWLQNHVSSQKIVGPANQAWQVNMLSHIRVRTSRSVKQASVAEKRNEKAKKEKERENPYGLVSKVPVSSRLTNGRCLRPLTEP